MTAHTGGCSSLILKAGGHVMARIKGRRNNKARAEVMEGATERVVNVAEARAERVRIRHFDEMIPHRHMWGVATHVVVQGTPLIFVSPASFATVTN